MHSTSVSARCLERVFNIDIETCRACGGAVRIIACIEGPGVIEKILTHLDAKAVVPEAFRLPPCRAPPQGQLVRLIHGQPHMLLRGCDTERRGTVAIVPTVGIP